MIRPQITAIFRITRADAIRPYALFSIDCCKGGVKIDFHDCNRFVIDSGRGCVVNLSGEIM